MPSDKDWAGRYKGSDHHIDRYVRNKLNYEFKTGAPYPVQQAPDPWEEKDKGREQGFHSPDNMVVVTTRRCRSVPPSVVELNYDYGYGPASRKAHRISQYMTDDQDAIRSASRRQDAALLRNITSRMQDTADYRGVGVDYRTPIHVPRRARAHSPVITHISRSGRASSVPRNFRESQYEEEEFFLPRGRARLMEVPRWEDWTPYFYKPITSYVSHQVRHRAGSEPPVDRRAHVHVAAHVPTFSTAYVSPAQRYTTPSVDLAVRQARGALGRLERELGSGWEDPYYYEEEHVHRPVRPYSQASFERVTTVPAPRSYSPTMRTHYSPVIPRRSRVADIEASLEATYMPETMSTYAGLRSRAAEARSKVDMHKTMMDRYLPIHLGPEKDVGMPQLERYRPSTVPSKVTPTPYRPVSRPERRMSLPSTPTRVVAAAPPRRAPMSDARKRAREVLCKTKRDPEYYSY